LTLGAEGRRRRRGPGYLRRLGPGIVTGAADDDPSGIGTYAQVGASFGFGLLWTTLATLALAVFGTTISPYLFFWQAGEEVEEQAEHHRPADRGHLAAMRVDVAAGMGSGVG
jgi:Mn2+/Fe2+ NRAMP family transporter